MVGWPSVLHGEATAGDVLAMRTVGRSLAHAGFRHDTAWSHVMCPPDGLLLDDADPGRYSHLVFACGPATGKPLRELHERFARSTRIAIGVSVIDPADPAVTGFHRIIARDQPAAAPRPDLATAAPAASGIGLPPTIGVFLTGGQREYGGRRRHDGVIGTVESWLAGVDAGLLDLDTRLDPRDWRLPSTPEQLQSVIRRLDAVVTMRMHGLVLALRSGVPALALDPVDGGGKVTAQARALGWPSILSAEEVTAEALDRGLQWCLTDGAAPAPDTSGVTVPTESLVNAGLGELIHYLGSD